MSNPFFLGFADELMKMAGGLAKFKGMDANGKPIFESVGEPPTKAPAPAPATAAPAPAAPAPKIYDQAKKALGGGKETGGYKGIGGAGSANQKALEEANKR